MPAEAARFRLALHATAVSIGDRALLICGASRAGKSRLAFALIAASTRRRPIRLIGDDRVVLSDGRRGLMVGPHPRIGGFIERRGLGIVALPFTASASVGGLVELGSKTPWPEELQNFPRLAIVNPIEADARRDLVLAWWDTRGEAGAPHLARKTGPARVPLVKD